MNDSDYAIYASSVALYRKALTDQAIDKINILINKYPTNPWYYELKGQILYESGKINHQLNLMKKLLNFLKVIHCLILPLHQLILR